MPSAAAYHPCPLTRHTPGRLQPAAAGRRRTQGPRLLAQRPTQLLHKLGDLGRLLHAALVIVLRMGRGGGQVGSAQGRWVWAEQCRGGVWVGVSVEHAGTVEPGGAGWCATGRATRRARA